jgi:TPR repeat protein
VKWYRKAAEQGIFQAQFNLGNRYANGQGVLQDYAEVLNWYRKAADQGFADAQSGFMDVPINSVALMVAATIFDLVSSAAAEEGTSRAPQAIVIFEVLPM